MRAFLRKISLGLAAVTISLWLAPPAAAQTEAWQTVQFTIGGGPVGATHSPREFARYYAPYAVLAAAAYEHVKNFDDTRGSSTGADVVLAARQVFYQQRQQAQNLLQDWRYQFGHEGYLGCWDETDKKCAAKKAKAATASTNGLSFQVWTLQNQNGRKDVCSQVGIAFRGSEFTFQDWQANLHYWLGRKLGLDDEYVQLGRNIDAILRSITKLQCFERAGGRTTIVAIGHSLGGGLAQFAALANAPTGPRIRKVFAFNSSPVTAEDLINPNIVKANKNGLTIDRINQQGEALTVLSTTYYPPETPAKSCDPLVRQVEFNAFAPEPPKKLLRRLVQRFAPGVDRLYGSLELHRIQPLASQLVAWSYVETDRQLQEHVSLPPPSPDCHPDYKDLPPKQTAPVVAQVRGGRVIYAAQRIRRVPAEINRSARTPSFDGDGDGFGANRIFADANAVSIDTARPKPRAPVPMAASRKVKRLRVAKY